MAIINYQYKFEIDSVDVTSYVLVDSKINYKKNNDTGDYAEIYIYREVSSIISLGTSSVLKVYRGVNSPTEKCIFSGDIKSIKGRDEETLTLKASNFINRLRFDPFTKSYDKNIDIEAGEVSAIFSNIAEDAGFTVNAVSSGTDSTSILLDKFISANNYRLERMNVLANILNWFFRYDYDKDEIVLQPQGTTEYSTKLVVGENILNIPDWEEDIDNMRNKITVEGAVEFDTREESDTGDGTTVEFDLEYPPETTELTVNGTLKKRGVVGTQDTYDYFVDKQLKKYTFVTPPGIGDTIVMKYSTFIPTPVTGSEPTSVTRYNGLIQHEVFEFNDVLTIEDATVRVNQLLELLAFAEVYSYFNVSEYDINVGDTIDVEDSTNPTYNGTYVVSEKNIVYGTPYDIIKIGTDVLGVSNIYRVIEERLRLISQSNREVANLLRHLFNLSSSLIFKNRYIIKQKRDVSTDYLWGNTTWNGGFWQDGYNEEPVNYQIQQGRLTYEEYFYDEDFKDSVNNTCTWNTTTKELTFTSGQRYQTTSIFLDSTNQSTVKKATLNYTGTGTFVLEMSANGGTDWETVENGVEYTFTNTGSDLRIRISTEAYQFVTSDGEDFITSDGENFKVQTGGSGTITYVSCTHSL